MVALRARRVGHVPASHVQTELQQVCIALLALWRLGAAARRVGAGTAVGLDVSAGSLVLQAISILDLFANRPLVLTDMLV